MKCPNCGADIGRFDLSQNCKNCGVNLFYSRQEELLARDAKRCELEFASFRLLVARIKTAYIKGALPIVRLVFMVLLICVLLIPFAEIHLDIPFYSGKLNIGGLGMYFAFTDGSLLALLDYVKIGVSADIVLKAIVLIAAIVLTVVCGVVMFAFLLLSFVNIQKTAKALAVASSVGTVMSVVDLVLSIVVANAAKAFSSGMVSASFGVASIVCFVAMLGMAVINYLFIKKNIQPEYKEIDVERKALLKKVKKGEVSLDDLPLPVFETQEEKEAREALVAENVTGGDAR